MIEKKSSNFRLVDFTKKFSINGCVSEMSTTSDLRFCQNMVLFLLLGVISDLSTPYILGLLSQTESNDYRN